MVEIPLLHIQILKHSYFLLTNCMQQMVKQAKNLQIRKPLLIGHLQVLGIPWVLQLIPLRVSKPINTWAIVGDSHVGAFPLRSHLSFVSSSGPHLLQYEISDLERSRAYPSVETTLHPFLEAAIVTSASSLIPSKRSSCSSSRLSLEPWLKFCTL